MREVTHWKKTFLKESLTLSADVVRNYNFALSDIYVEENDIGPLFRFYRLRGVKIRFFYSQNQGISPNNQLGWLYVVRNTSSTGTAGGSASPQWYLNANCAIRRLDKLDGTNSYSTFYVRVKPVEVNSDSINQAQYQSSTKRNDWISTDGRGMDMLHRGLDFLSHPGTGSTGVLDVWMTYYFTCKNPR